MTRRAQKARRRRVRRWVLAQPRTRGAVPLLPVPSALSRVPPIVAFASPLGGVEPRSRWLWCSGLFSSVGSVASVGLPIPHTRDRDSSFRLERDSGNGCHAARMANLALVGCCRLARQSKLVSKRSCREHLNAHLLIDAVVQQTMVFIAQLATSGGLRTPVAQVANQVF